MRISFKIILALTFLFLIIPLISAVTVTGGTITTDGIYTVHTFTSNGSFNISSGSLDLTVLIVAGGGAGGNNYSGGGGGAGGLIYNTSYVATGGINVIVGSGGIQGNGSNSVFGVLTAIGGGVGGSGGLGDVRLGSNGGSGGGGSTNGATPYTFAGGNGTGTQGKAGGWSGIDYWVAGGGGGGAGTAGVYASGVNGSGGYGTGGAGGNGTNYSINGSDVYYAGGGGGGTYTQAGASAGKGGLGGGGNGTLTGNPTPGINGTGGGGGASGDNITGKGADGGSGIVIVRYTITTAPIITFESDTETDGNIKYNLSNNNIFSNITVSDFNPTNTTINLYNSTGLYASISNDTTGNFSYNFTNLPNGIYYLNATSTNGTNIINTTDTRTVIIYGISITATYTANYTTRDAVINYTANTTPYANHINYFLLDLLNSDGTLNKTLGNNSASLNYTLNFYTNEIRDGIYKVRIHAYDNASQTNNATGIDIVLDYPNDYLNVNVININFSVGWNNNNSANISYSCINEVWANNSINATFNAATITDGIIQNNTVAYNYSYLIDGSNTLLVTCYDFQTRDVRNLTRIVHIKQIILIDEIDNIEFNVTNLSSVRVYYDDNSTYYDFQDEGNISAVNFTLNDSVVLRFEFVRATGDRIIVYANLNITDNPLRVCVNKEGVTEYEQILLSSGSKASKLKNVFANCIVASDYTRFAYQNAYILKAYTISSQYYLYTVSAGTSVYLASVDGSVQTYINLDVLEFNRQSVSMTVQGDALSFQRLTNSTIKIYYRNLRNDNTETNISISRVDTGALLFTASETTTPNEFTIYFDYTTISNITNQTVFGIQIDRVTTAGKTYTIKKYFNTGAKSGVIAAGMAMVISILLMVFGLTFTRASTALGWFGIFCVVGSIAILTLAIMTWYILMLMALEIIIMVYIFIVLTQQNYGALT